MNINNMKNFNLSFAVASFIYGIVLAFVGDIPRAIFYGGLSGGWFLGYQYLNQFK